jgi:hypothetical protein
MLVSEQKLSVEIREINSVQINYMNLSEAAEHQILQQFASDAAGANHQQPRLNNDD